MASNDKFDKKELLQMMQDSFEMNDGNIANMLTDIKSMMSIMGDNDTDEFVKALKNNDDKLRAFYADAVEKLRDGEDITINVSNTSNVDSTTDNSTKSTNTTNNSTTDNITRTIPSDTKNADKTFKQVMNEQIAMNNDFISDITNSSNFNAKTMGAMTQRISDVINAEVFQQTGESIPDNKADKMVANALGSFVDAQYKHTQQSTNMLKSVYDSIGSGATKLFGTKLGSMAYDSMNHVAMGQLGVVETMYGAAGKFLDVTDDMGGVVEGMLGNMNKTKEVVGAMYDGINNQVNGILGQEKENLVDPIMDAGKATTNAFGMTMDKDAQQLQTSEKSKNLLQEVVDNQRKQLNLDHQLDLEADREGGDKKSIKEVVGDFVDNIVVMLSSVVMGLGLLIGGAVGAVLLPFRVLGKAVSYFASLLKLTSFGPVAKVVDLVSTAVGKFVGLTKSVGGLLTKIPMVGKLIAKFGKYFAKGFKLLGWPIQILLGIIDFVKGFIGSDADSFAGKMMDGVKEVFMGFFELPIKLLGWMYDKVLGMFGVESSGTGDKLMAGFGSFLDMILDPLVKVFNIIVDAGAGILGGLWKALKSGFKILGNIFGFLWNLVTLDFEGMGANLGGIWDGIKGVFSGLAGAVINFFALLPKMVMSMIGSSWNNLKTFLSTFSIFDPLVAIMDKIGAFFSSIGGWLIDKVSGIPIIGGLIKKAFGGSGGSEKSSQKEPVVKKEPEVSAVNRQMSRNGVSVTPTQMGEFKKQDFEDKVKWDAKSDEMMGRVGPTDDEIQRKREVEYVRIDTKYKRYQAEQDAHDEMMYQRSIAPPEEVKPEKKGLWGRMFGGGDEKASDFGKGNNIRPEPIGKSVNNTTSPTRPAKKIEPISYFYDTPDKWGRFNVIKDIKPTGSGWREMTHDEKIGMINETATQNNLSDAMDWVGLPLWVKDTGGSNNLQTTPRITPQPQTIDQRGMEVVDVAKAGLAKRQMEASATTTKAVNKMNKDAKDKPERPIVVNTGGEGQRSVEPPEDIESMSILFLNKSWGLG